MSFEWQFKHYQLKIFKYIPILFYFTAQWNVAFQMKNKPTVKCNNELPGTDIYFIY